jgi:hypothetical protein
MDGEREFHTYEARGACHTRVTDDGTISPSAAGWLDRVRAGDLPARVDAMRERYGDHVYRRYGFVDAFNPTLARHDRVPYGKIVPAWAGSTTTTSASTRSDPRDDRELAERTRVAGHAEERAPRRGLLAAGFRGAGSGERRRGEAGDAPLARAPVRDRAVRAGAVRRVRARCARAG